MYTFRTPDMSCGHCVKTITDSIRALDANAVIRTDLEHKTVQVESSASEAVIRDALNKAGYPPAN